MSKFIEHEASAEMHLSSHQSPGADENRNIAAVQAWTLLALAHAVRDVADTIRDKPREQ